MARREYVDYLRDMLDAAEKVRNFVAGMQYEDFMADEKTLFAVVRALEIIGEASKKVPKPVRDKYPELPWRVMAGTRDRLVHEYFGVDREVVWQTLREDIPQLIPVLRKLVAEASNDENQK